MYCPASRGFCLAWLLAFATVGRLHGSVSARSCFVYAHGNDFAIAINHAREKPLLAG